MKKACSPAFPDRNSFALDVFAAYSIWREGDTGHGPQMEHGYYSRIKVDFGFPLPLALES